MGDTTPIPAPRRGLSGSTNLTVQVKFAPDQPLLPPWHDGNEHLKILTEKQQKLNLKNLPVYNNV